MARNENRSAFGRLLHEEILDRDENNKILQKDLANGNTGLQSAISRMISYPGIFAYDHTLYEQLYAIFKTLAELHVPLSEDQVRKLLATIPSKPSIHLTETQQNNLIAQLLLEKIARRELRTLQGIQVIGRDEIIRTILVELQDLKPPALLTIVGAPGVGKSEIARQLEILATEQGYFSHVCFLPLEKISVVEEAMQLIKNHPGLQSKEIQTLLILDNCEQLRTLTVPLHGYLATHRNVTILATSRIALNWNEKELEPLTLPASSSEPLATLEENSGAIQLFCTYAHMRDSNFHLTEEDAPYVAELCIGLDGLPLALLIGASWVKNKGVKGLFASLHNLEIQVEPH